MKYLLASCAIVTALNSVPARADPKIEIQPVQLGDEKLRWQKGYPTLDLRGKAGSVQIRRLLWDHGAMVFAVAVYNESDVEADFDTENVTIEIGGKTYRAMTVRELEQKAENRAMWTQLAIGLSGALAATAAASQRDRYSSSYRTPRGTYRFNYSAPSAAGQIQATALTAGTAVAIVEVRNRLDRTLTDLGEEIIQRTTISPGESYAGRLVMTKVRLTKMMEPMVLTVKWNGEDYRFAFRAAKLGTPEPVWIRKVVAETPAPPSLPTSPD